MNKTATIAAVAVALAAPAHAAQASAEEAAAAAVVALGAAALGTIADSADQAVIAPLTAVVIPTVPEPQTWGMMIIGFGFVGFMVRRRRAAPAI
ncbi:MAG: PEPxxWA-CTERM sorting domain-containing protein [Thermaurantiacus sp.]